MGALDWFMKDQPQEEKTITTESVITSENDIKISSVELTDLIKSAQTELYTKFLEQLELLKSIGSLDEKSRYQAAMATSKISIDEINSNLSNIRTTLINNLNDYITKLKEEATKAQFDLETKNKELQKQIEEKDEQRKIINEEVKAIGVVIADNEINFSKLNEKISLDINASTTYTNSFIQENRLFQDSINKNLGGDK